MNADIAVVIEQLSNYLENPGTLDGIVIPVKDLQYWLSVVQDSNLVLSHWFIVRYLGRSWDRDIQL